MDRELAYRWKNNILIGLVILFVIVSILLYKQESPTFAESLKYTNNEPIIFNYKSGLYDRALDITLSKNIELPLGAEIYYTLNGDDPDNTSILYSNKIHINETTVYPLKAIVYYNGEYSDIYQQTYVLEKDKPNLPIISITSDGKNLYDYYSGIMVKGITYEENERIADEGDYIKGNFNNREDDWIRPAKVTMFDRHGNVLLDRDIGIGVAGGTSASMDVKSFKLISNYETDETFEFDFVNEGTEYSSTSLVSEYNNIKIKSGGQDTTQGNIKSSIASRLARQSNFDGITTTTRVSVYLNGKFYGIFDMQQTYSNSTLARKFNIADSNKILKFKSSEDYVLTVSALRDLLNTDLNEEKNRIALEEKVDIDNMLLYYSLELLMNNTDWPGNNYEIWKYTGEYEEGNKYTDGRYRFLIYDTDLIYYTDKNDHMFDGDVYDQFKAIMEGKNRAQNSALIKLIQVEEYKNKFITMLTDLLNTSFKKENVVSIIDEEYEKIRYENSKHFIDKSIEIINKYIIITKLGALEDLMNVQNDIEQYFGVNEKYELNISCTNGIKTYWNNMEIYGGENYFNNYYKGVNFTIKNEAYPGYGFKYWLVNGRKIYTKDLQITDELIENDMINIKAVAEKTNMQKLIISEISAKDNNDWIKISNISNEQIDLSKFYISDDNDNLQKYRLPKLTLNEGESIIFNGSKNYSEIGDYLCNFSLNNEETVYLYDGKEIIDKIKVPRMSKNETYGKFKNSNTYMFFNNLVNERKVSTY